MKAPKRIKAAEGKLAVLLPGLGAVATTTIAGVMLARRGLAAPIGSLTQMGTIPAREADERPLPEDQGVRLRSRRLDDLEFGGWDIFPDDAYEAAVHADVLEPQHLDAVKDELSGHPPDEGRLLPRVREAASRAARQERAQRRPTWSSSCATTSASFMKERGCDARGRRVVRLDRDVPRAGRGAPVDRVLRGGPPEQRAGDLELADLRVGVPQGGRPLRQRRAQPLRRLPGRVGARARARRRRRRQGLQDRPDADEDGHRPRP